MNMNQRRSGQEDAAWSSRRVHVPSRSATQPHIGARQQPVTTEDRAPIPLLDDKGGDEQAPRTIDINLNVPALPRIPFRKSISRLVKLTRRHKMRTTLLILGVGVGSYFLWPPENSPLSRESLPTIGKVKTEKIEQKPEYRTVLPQGKTIEDLGGWSRVSPPSSAPVFAYPDTVNSVKVNVSQQQLPASLKEESVQIENLAKGFNATEKITVGNHTAYIGTSAQGPQSVIFVKEDLLILIKSSSKLTNDEWAAYISSLQ